MKFCDECQKAKSQWKMEYDPTLQQTYYVNLGDNTVSFDSPCEVSHKPPKGKTGKKGGRFAFGRKSANESDDSVSRKSVMTRIGSVLSMISSRSQESKSPSRIENSSDSTMALEAGSHSKYSDTEKINQDDLSPLYKWDSSTIGANARSRSEGDDCSFISGIDDEYLLNNPINFKNFAGTAHTSGANSVDGASMDDSDDSYSYYYESDNEIKSFRGDSYELEQERQALRYQIINELE